MAKLTISYFGAPLFSARVLERIILEFSDEVTIQSVFTQPDRKAGRKQILTPTPVKLLAQKHSIPVFDDLLISTNEQQLKDVDLVLLYAYGKILPQDVLKMPKWGFWNIHPSLLPKYRGTSPIAYSLLMGDKTTGVSLMEMDERMDHGPILKQQEYEIKSEDTREDLEKRLSDIGYELFKQSIQLLLNGSLQKTEQNNNKRTITRLLTKENGFIPLSIVQKIIKLESLKKNEIPPIIAEYSQKYLLSNQYQSLIAYYNLFRGLSPWPGLWTILPGDKRLKITGMELKNNVPIITKVQLEGKKEVDFVTFNTAYTFF